MTQQTPPPKPLLVGGMIVSISASLVYGSLPLGLIGAFLWVLIIFMGYGLWQHNKAVQESKNKPAPPGMLSLKKDKIDLTPLPSGLKECAESLNFIIDNFDPNVTQSYLESEEALKKAGYMIHHLSQQNKSEWQDGLAQLEALHTKLTDHYKSITGWGRPQKERTYGPRGDED